MTPTPPPNREPAGRPWSAIVVAVVGLAIVAFGFGGKLVASPAGGKAPTANPSTVSAPSPSVAAVRTAGTLPTIEGTDEVVYDASHDAEAFEGMLVQPIATLEMGPYTLTVACSGPGDLTIERGDGSGVGPPLTSPCDGTVVIRELEIRDTTLELNANASASTAWHIVISRPSAADAVPPSTPNPTLAPLVATVPCGTGELRAPPAVSIVSGGHSYPGTVSMTSWNGTDAEATVDADLLPAVTISGSGGAVIRTADDACAVAWTIEAQSPGFPDPAPGPLITLATHGSGLVAARPFALSRSPIDGLGPGLWLLRATLTFDRGSETVWWRVKVDTFLFPRAALTSGGRTASGLDIGCPSWEVAGDGGSDECGPIPWPIDEAPPLRVVGDEPVTFAVPGWGSLATARVSSASAARSTAKAGEAPAKVTTISIDDGRLVLPYGDLAVLVTNGATRPDAGFRTDYLFHVVHVRP